MLYKCLKFDIVDKGEGQIEDVACARTNAGKEAMEEYRVQDTCVPLSELTLSDALLVREARLALHLSLTWGRRKPQGCTPVAGVAP